MKILHIKKGLMKMSLQELIERFPTEFCVNENGDVHAHCTNCLFRKECGLEYMDLCEDYQSDYEW